MANDNDSMSKPVTKPHNIVVEGTIPVLKDQLVISSRKITTAEVQVTKEVAHQEVDVPLQTVHTRYRELRMPINRIVETMPQVRQVDGNIIIPVVREEEVVIKRLVLVEEIHLMKHTDVEERTETVDLRSETASVRRITPEKEYPATPE